MNPRDGSSERLGRATRGILVGFALALVAMLVVASRLQPDPKGYGTHTQLGLWPCAFRATTGQPCPTCGMTTSFAWSVRGELVMAWRSNPAGSLLAPLSFVLIVWLLIAAVRGRSWPFRTLETPLISLAVAVVALIVLSWTVRMTLGRALG